MIPTSKEKLIDRMITKILTTNMKLHQPFVRKESESNILETTSRDVDFNELKTLVCTVIWKTAQKEELETLKGF